MIQWADPGLLGQLERTHAELHGQPWRILTSLFVQDGGLVGTVSNLAFLPLLGAAAEQVVSCLRWLLVYFGVGAAGELVGYFWQPVGGGNSVAVCGLAGLLAVAMWRQDPRLPSFTEPAMLLWCAALLGTVSSRWYPAFVVAGVLAVRYVTRLRCRGVRTVRPVALTVVVSTAVLVVLHNIHGGALLAGLAVAAAGPAAAPWRRIGMDTPR
jgi:membrane associated rhomboid family serine protease